VNEPEYQAFGLPFDHRVDRFEKPCRSSSHCYVKGMSISRKVLPGARLRRCAARPAVKSPPLMIGAEGPRMLKLTAQYADLWNTGYMGKPETMAEPFRKIEAACREIGRDPATLASRRSSDSGSPISNQRKPTFFDDPLTGTAQEIAEAMRGYADLRVQQIMFQCEPYVPQALQRLTEALQLYRAMEQQ